MTRLQNELLALRPRLAAAAQKVYDDWEQDEDGMDEMLGSGGICSEIAVAFQGVIERQALDTQYFEGGQEGDDHGFLVVQRDDEAYGVDIPPGVYESGGGYNWRKKVGVVIRPDHVVVFPVPVQEGGEYEDT